MTIAITLVGEVRTQRLGERGDRRPSARHLDEVAEVPRGERDHHERRAVAAGEILAVLAIYRVSEARPVHFKLGERLRIVLVNDTMMTHPIHLHGMWSELEDARGEFQVRKHTVSVQPAQRVTYLVSADAPGHWAYHCHLMYHMEAGMFREVVVA